MKKGVFTLIICLLQLLEYVVYSQNCLLNQLIVPPSPNVTSFQCLDFSKVNLYNGLPVVNIPIYEINLNGYKYPISLNYNYNGFKIDEIAGWVGLGWNLNAGGMISAIIHGKGDDDQNFGYNKVRKLLNIPDPVNEETAYLNFLSQMTDDVKRKFANGEYDGIPDEYFLKANDLSGSIIALNNEKYGIVPFRPYSVIRTNLKRWDVTDELGNQYIFGAFDGTDEGGIEYTNTVTATSDPVDITSKNLTSWFLRKIITSKGETITFNYEKEINTRPDIISENRYYLLPSQVGCSGLSPQNVVTTTLPITTWRISSIITNNSSVYFYASTKRNDIETTNTSKCLDSIVVKNYLNQKVKKYVFSYSYLGNTQNYSTCRLMLNSVYESDNKNQSNNPPYLFNYNTTTSIPLYGSKAADHWGYYNGSNGNTTLIPSVIPNSSYNNQYTGCANRETSPENSKWGLLTSIILPTGGSTTYSYEPNNYGSINASLNPKVYLTGSITDVANVTSTGRAVTVTSFADIDELQEVSINYAIDYNGYPLSESPIVSVYDSNSKIYFEKSCECTGTVTVSLPAGRYTLEVYAKDKGHYAHISLTHKYYKLDADGNKIYETNIITGGHRIKSIVQYDGIDHTKDKILTYNYSLTNEPRRSSGVLAGTPRYEYGMISENIFYSQSGIPFSGISGCKYNVRSSSSITSLFTSGGHIGYREVAVKEGVNGKTIYTFTSGFDYPDITFPKNAPNISREYLRSLPQSITIKDNLDNAIKTTNYYYNILKPKANLNAIAGIYLLEYMHNDVQDYLDKFDQPYLGLIKTDWIYQDQVIEKDYFNGNQVVNTKNYYYDNPVHAQLTRELFTSTSDNSSILTYNKYKDDYLQSASNVFTNMGLIHMIAPVIEQQIWKKNLTTNDSVLISGKINECYYNTLSNSILLNSVHALETHIPLNRGAFGSETKSNGLFTQLIPNSTYYKLKESYDYDNLSNIVMIQKADDISTYYIWGYQEQYPIAMIENFTSAKASAIQSNLLNPAITASNSDNDRTIGANGKEGDLRTALNNIRNNIALKDARVTTYTYDPLIGMTSSTDPNGVTTYYEYDTFGRLKCLRDDDGHILKTYEYHYKP
jgi:YD repeat-containing protein